MMSLLSTPSMIWFSRRARAAYSALPSRPCSSPAKAANTSVCLNSRRLITRASSITAAVPLPSSSIPGATASSCFPIQSGPDMLMVS